MAVIAPLAWLAASPHVRYVLKNLPAPSIDVAAGLGRIAGRDSNERLTYPSRLKPLFLQMKGNRRTP
jgi:hypothetical protein